MKTLAITGMAVVLLGAPALVLDVRQDQQLVDVTAPADPWPVQEDFYELDTREMKYKE